MFDHKLYRKRVTLGIFFGIFILVRFFLLTYYERDIFEKSKRVTPEVVQKLHPVKLPILTYHYVEHVTDPGDYIRRSLDITPEIFKKQLQTLKDEGYTTYFARDVPKILDGSMKIGGKSIILTFDDGYEDFYRVAYPILKSYHMKATVFMIYDFIDRKQFLKDKEIRELIRSGLVEIGSHTLNHINLKRVVEAVAREQIFESKQKMQNRYKIKVATFAYPYGAFKQATIDLVKEASYSAGFSVIKGQIHSGENMFFLSRIRMGSAYGKNMLKVLEKLNK